MKMNLTSLQRSVKTPKNQSLPSGNQNRNANSASPSHILGTEIKFVNNLRILKVVLTKEKFHWVPEPEFHSLYKGDVVWSKISEEVETSQCLDDFAERSLETEMFAVL